MSIIESFQGDYRFLSNFFIEPDGTCVEVEYQQSKCADPKDKARFYRGMPPGQAKRTGKLITLRDDWDRVKLSIMYKLVSTKFTEHFNLSQLLISTYPLELVEGNNWGDRFWGKVKGEGQNQLGIILMQIRDEIMV